MSGNPVVHFEMPYQDEARVTRFYADAFGWGMQGTGPEMGNYVVAQTADTDENRMVTRPGAINGGFYPRDASPDAAHPSVVIAVDDIDTAMGNVTTAGGTILGEPVMIPGVGRYVSFRDTEGNRASLLQPAPGADAPA
jgi:uncharacterized protein